MKIREVSSLFYKLSSTYFTGAITIITSGKLNERGCHLSLGFNQSSKKLKEYMFQRGAAVSTVEHTYIAKCLKLLNSSPIIRHLHTQPSLIVIQNYSVCIAIVIWRDYCHTFNGLYLCVVKSSLWNLSYYFPPQVDSRGPHVMRITPVPLYNSFNDVLRVYKLLLDALNDG